MVASYVAALRELALHSDYGDLPDMPRDHLVHGINHIYIREFKENCSQSPTSPSTTHFHWCKLWRQQRETWRLSMKTSRSPHLHCMSAKLILTLHLREKPGNQQLLATAVVAHISPHSVDTSIQCMCRSCKRGHLACACKSRSKPQRHKPFKNHYIKGTVEGQQVNTEFAPSTDSTEDPVDTYMFTLSTDSNGTDPYRVNVLLSGVAVQMELATRVSLTMINEATNDLLKYLPSCNPPPNKTDPQDHSEHQIQLLGVMDITVTVKYEIS